MSSPVLFLSLASMVLASDPAPVTPGKPSPAVEKFCDNSSSDEILASYGRVWGMISEQRGIGKMESPAIEDALVDLQTCRSIAAKSDMACQALAKIPYRGGEFEFLSGRCKIERAWLEFDDFLSGRSAPLLSCQGYFKETGLAESFSVPAAEVCGAIQSGGAGAVCGKISSRGWNYPDCRKDFPNAAKDCAGNVECLARFRLSEALRDRNPAACPAFLMHSCRVWIEGSPGECVRAEQTLRRMYCRLYQKADKRTKGQVGYDDAQIEFNRKVNEDIRARRKTKE